MEEGEQVFMLTEAGSSHGGALDAGLLLQNGGMLLKFGNIVVALINQVANIRFLRLFYINHQPVRQ